MPRTLSVVIRPNRLDIRFYFADDVVTDKDSECKVFPYEENGCRGIDLAPIRRCAC